jgi:hypothetical protein
LLDADTVRWNVVDFVGDDGDYLLELADSVLTSVQGVGNQMWQQMFNLDRTGPLADFRPAGPGCGFRRDRDSGRFQ